METAYMVLTLLHWPGFGDMTKPTTEDSGWEGNWSNSSPSPGPQSFRFLSSACFCDFFINPKNVLSFYHVPGPVLADGAMIVREIIHHTNTREIAAMIRAQRDRFEVDI